MKLSERSIHRLLFNTPMGNRFTQDSPILPDVWRAFARNPELQHDLILSPKYGVPAGKIANYVLHALRNDDSADVAYLPGRVVAKLTFKETLQIVLPNTQWWRKTFGAIGYCESMLSKEGAVDNDPKLLLAWAKHKEAKKELGELLYLYWKKGQLGGVSGEQLNQAGRRRSQEEQKGSQIPSSLSPDGLWFIRMVGMLACLCSEHKKITINEVLLRQLIKNSSPPLLNFQELIDCYLTSYRDENQLAPETTNEIGKFVSSIIAQEFLALFRDVERVVADVDIWSVNRNRDAVSCIKKSILAVKGDAARLLFEIDCSKITWAVVDGGVNSRHPAFLGPPKLHSGTLIQTSRVKETLDFRGIRSFLDPKILSKLSVITAKSIPDVRVEDDPVLYILGCLFNRQKGFLDQKNDNFAWFDIAKEGIEIRLSELNTRLRKGFEIDWADLEFLIRDPNPSPPINDHGTHVAGILAADWNEYETDNRGVITNSKPVMKGMCPNISVMDVRVLRDDGRSDEFEVMAALQYIRYRNQRSGFKEIHGVNLSLSIHHEIKNFACGRTPICDECTKTVADGIVVVSAAGNAGYTDDADLEGSSIRYQASSITDPGNTEDVITVGSTHRSRPHEYGVSYFSSRGPTGDGRVKPDIVAPGEKINAPVGIDDHDYKDGTSMAAPHVSGAAALLMARHKELIGDPQRIKEILCDTATDLGREKYFQGHGMLDILRALQSV